ncbi:MAG: membrane integrity-associated transporter subunit PqiC [Gammaproteobacteria bacterium]|nr:membrane integrity-associated transporter subunit PqiC [Gammaproteobacteria bacterium]
MNPVRFGPGAALACLCAVTLPGCTGALLRSNVDPPITYRLAAGQGAKDPAIGVDLEVLNPLLEAGLDTDRIAAGRPDGRLDYFAGARWNGRLGEVFGQLAVQEFRARSGLRNVVGAASELRPPVWLEIEVTAFQAEYPAAGAAPVIRVHLVARLGDVRRRTTLGSYVADVSRTATADRLGAIVAAFDAAADQALARIVADTDRTLRARPHGAPGS